MYISEANCRVIMQMLNVCIGEGIGPTSKESNNLIQWIWDNHPSLHEEFRFEFDLSEIKK